MIIDFSAINSVWFWIFAAVAVVAVRLTGETRYRAGVLAAFNAAFIILLLGSPGMAVLFAILVTHLLVKFGDSQGWSAGLFSVLGLAVLALFVTNKLGALSLHLSAITPLRSLLTAVGFSYIALRFYDMARSVNERQHPWPSLFGLINYLVPFHMLTAGPIQGYHDFVSQSAIDGPLTPRTVLAALDRVASGAFKKLVLAVMVQKVFLTDYQAGFPYALLEAQFWLLWLYLDFSAYSDIAKGLGIAMGVATPENFDRPFASRNLTVFWERWHISLSQFVRRNMFIPAQVALMRRPENLNPRLCASLATLFSFTLIGLWHGLTPGWLAWGFMHAVGLVVVREWTAVLPRRLTAPQLARYRASRAIEIVGMIITYVYVAFAFAMVFWIDR